MAELTSSVQLARAELFQANLFAETHRPLIFQLGLLALARAEDDGIDTLRLKSV